MPPSSCAIDSLMIKLDGTENLESQPRRQRHPPACYAGGGQGRGDGQAACCALYRYIGGANAKQLPVPMANIINGGKHADNKVDFQEFMVMPVGAKTWSEAIRMTAVVFHTLKGVLKKAGHNTNVGDEGGFAPNLDNEEALKFIMEAIVKAGYQPGRDKDFAIAMDCASSELFDEGEKKGYKFWKSNPGKLFSANDMIELFAGWAAKYPIISIEDPLDQDDWSGYTKMTQRMGKTVQVVGDDFFVTNPKRLAEGITKGACNSILVKVNQIGTLSETLDAVQMAQKAGYTAILSHRSGETEDVTIADIAVASNCGQIKTGSTSRTDRIAKYNQLLRIEEELGARGAVPRPEDVLQPLPLNAPLKAMDANGKTRPSGRVLSGGVSSRRRASGARHALSCRRAPCAPRRCRPCRR